MPRLFIALPIGVPVVAELARVRASVEDVQASTTKDVRSRGGGPTWRWVRPEHLHLTLAFLGDTDEVDVPRVEDALLEAALGVGPLDLTAAGLGAFPDLERARVLWAGVEGDVDRLRDLQARLVASLSAAGFPLEDRGYSPHITLARSRLPVATTLSSGAATRFGNWLAEEARLVESHLEASGPRYETRARVLLSTANG